MMIKKNNKIINTILSALMFFSGTSVGVHAETEYSIDYRLRYKEWDGSDAQEEVQDVLEGTGDEVALSSFTDKMEGDYWTKTVSGYKVNAEGTGTDIVFANETDLSKKIATNSVDLVAVIGRRNTIEVNENGTLLKTRYIKQPNEMINAKTLFYEDSEMSNYTIKSCTLKYIDNGEIQTKENTSEECENFEIEGVFKMIYDVEKTSDTVTATFYTTEGKENVFKTQEVARGEAPGNPDGQPEVPEGYIAFSYWYPDPTVAISKNTEYIPIFATECDAKYTFTFKTPNGDIPAKACYPTVKVNDDYGNSQTYAMTDGETEKTIDLTDSVFNDYAENNNLYISEVSIKSENGTAIGMLKYQTKPDATAYSLRIIASDDRGHSSTVLLSESEPFTVSISDFDGNEEEVAVNEQNMQKTYETTGQDGKTVWVGCSPNKSCEMRFVDAETYNLTYKIENNANEGIEAITFNGEEVPSENFGEFGKQLETGISQITPEITLKSGWKYVDSDNSLVDTPVYYDEKGNSYTTSDIAQKTMSANTTYLIKIAKDVVGCGEKDGLGYCQNVETGDGVNDDEQIVATFKKDGEVLGYQVVKVNENAQDLGVGEPERTRTFTGWDKSLESLTEDTEFNAQYQDKKNNTLKFNYDGKDTGLNITNVYDGDNVYLNIVEIGENEEQKVVDSVLIETITEDKDYTNPIDIVEDIDIDGRQIESWRYVRDENNDIYLTPQYTGNIVTVTFDVNENDKEGVSSTYMSAIFYVEKGKTLKEARPEGILIDRKGSTESDVENIIEQMNSSSSNSPKIGWEYSDGKQALSEKKWFEEGSEAGMTFNDILNSTDALNESKVYKLYLMKDVIGCSKTDKKCLNTLSSDGIDDRTQRIETYKDDTGKVLANRIALKNEKAQYPLDNKPEKEGYSFKGWTPELSKISEDTTYTATYEINQYEVTISYKKHTVYSGELDYGTKVKVVDEDNKVVNEYTVEAKPLKEELKEPAESKDISKTFDKWAYKTESDGSVTIYPTYKTKTFTVKYVDHDDKTLDTVTVEYGKNASTKVVPDNKEGYTFKEWNDEGKNIIEDRTIKAKYEIKKYHITVQYDKKNVYDNKEMPFSSEIIVKTRTGTKETYKIGNDKLITSSGKEIKIDETGAIISIPGLGNDGYYYFKGWNKPTEKMEEIKENVDGTEKKITVTFSPSYEYDPPKRDETKPAGQQVAPAACGANAYYNSTTYACVCATNYQGNPYSGCTPIPGSSISVRPKPTPTPGQNNNNNNTNGGNNRTNRNDDSENAATISVISDNGTTQNITVDYGKVVEYRDEQGNVIYKTKVTNNGKISAPDAPKKEGFTFKGWKAEKDGDGNLIVVAFYEENESLFETEDNKKIGACLVKLRKPNKTEDSSAQSAESTENPKMDDKKNNTDSAQDENKEKKKSSFPWDILGIVAGGAGIGGLLIALINKADKKNSDDDDEEEEDVDDAEETEEDSEETEE